MSLYSELAWRSFTVPAGAAGAVTVTVGEVGTGEPRAVVVAGVHGDEGPWGALAIRRLLEHSEHTLKGSLRVILASNPLAAAADARNAPLDGVDLNRSFPGNPEGSHTERLAAGLTPFLEDADLVIDLHGGGSWCVNAFTFRFEGSEDLARDIGAPFTVDIPEKVGTLTQHAKARGAKVLAVEMGGRSRDELLWRDHIAEGLGRVLHNQGVLALEPPPSPAGESTQVGPSRVLRPSHGGVFVPTVREDRVGRVVAGGTELGQVLDMTTLEPLERFTAPFDRTALLLLRPHIGVIEGGAMLYVVAEPV